MRTDFMVTENMWRAVLLVLSCSVLLVTVWCLLQGITIIFMHLYYLPIVLLAYHYRRTGFWLAVLLSILYLALVMILLPGDAETVGGAVLRVIMFIGIAAIIVYLVERSDAEKALRESEEKFRAIADYTVDWELWFGPDGRCLWVNSAVKEFTGYSPEEILAMPDLIPVLVAPEDRPAVVEHFRSAISGSRGENIEFRCLHRNGTIRWIAASWQPVLGADGKFLGTRASGRDITDKKRTEEALLESEEKYRTLFERADDAVIIMNESSFLDCNPAALRLYRCTRDRFVGRSPLDFSPEIQPNGMRSDERAKVKIQAALGGAPQTFYWMHCRADGTLFDAEVALNRVVLKGQVFLQAMVRDISARKQLERALSESESRLRSFIEATGDSVVIIDEEGKVIEWNPASERITGLRKEETLGRYIWDVTYGMALPEHRTERLRAAIEQSMRDMLSTGISIYSEPRIVEAIRPDGTRITTRQMIFPIKTPKGFRVGSIAQDVTSERAAAAALEESNRRLTTLIASLQGMVYRCRNDPGWTLEYVSEGCIPLTGYSPEEYVTKRSIAYGDLIHPDDRQQVWDGVQKGLAARRPYQLRYRLVHRDGSIHWVGEIGQGVFGTDGALLALEGYNADITAWQTAEEELKKALALLNETQEVSHLGGWVYDIRSGSITWTDEVYRIHGVTKDFDPSRVDHDLEFYPLESSMLIREAFRRCCEEAVPYDLEADLVRADGRQIRVRTMGSPVLSGGKVIRVHGNIMDITKRWQTEQALRESNARFREQFRSNPLAIFIWQQKGDDFVLADCNEAADRLTEGRSRKYLGKMASELYASRPETLANVRQCFSSHQVDSRELVSEHFLPGRVIHTTTAFIPPDLIMVHMEDVTERKEAETALLEKTALLEAQLHSARDGILVVDNAGKKILQNERTIELWKIPRDVAADPDDARQVRHVMHMTKDPEGFVRKVLWLYDHPDENSEDIVELIDGTVLERGSYPVRGRDGRNYGRIWNFRDITERKREEATRERLITELARKNAELDRFTYTVSHDLKSPLIAIRAFLSLLNDDISSGNTARAVTDLQHINGSTQKLEELINTLLTLSRSGRTVSTPLPVPLADVVKAAGDLLSGVIGSSGTVLSVDPNLPVVMGDRERLLQVMTNLLDNAVKFMGDQKSPEIRIGIQQGEHDTVFFVRDNGMGIRPDDLPRVFGLYERFYPDIPGTGIGLATVKRIIEAHGGTIWAESEGEGKGTTFFFTLPVAGETGTDSNNNG